MRLRLQKWTLCKTVLTAVFGLIGSFALAETYPVSHGTAPRAFYPPTQPCLPAPGPTTTMPRVTDPVLPTTPTPLPSFSGETAGAGLGGAVAVADPNYIDGAIPRSQFRLRYDTMYGNNRPDRAEFFYGKCACTGAADAKGPPLTETGVDSQELSAYLELTASERLSGFVEVPVRLINPEQNRNQTGLSDINFGFKYAVVYDEDQVLTVQVRGVTPTGDAFRGLGRENWIVEPALLYQRRLSDRLFLLGEVRDFIPISPESDFAGSVLRYGIGFSYIAYDSCNLRIAPIAEFVGWSVLNGKKLDVRDINNAAPADANGDTIANAKLGVRFSFGPADGGPSALGNSDLAISYGRALTGEVWYKDIIRVEYRMRF